MKRAPIVLTGTVAGVVGLLSYHAAAPSTNALAGIAGRAAASTSATPSTATTASAAPTATTASAATTSSAASRSSTATLATRTVTGQDVSYQYGDLEVRVTATGRRIKNISLVRLDITDPHSQAIDQDAIPQLQQQALAAQSAKINGVSGASYTSAAYEQSLQSALDKLA